MQITKARPQKVPGEAERSKQQENQREEAGTGPRDQSDFESQRDFHNSNKRSTPSPTTRTRRP